MGHYGGSYKVTYDLHKKYGDLRLLDTPICGAHSAPADCKMSSMISAKFRIPNIKHSTHVHRSVRASPFPSCGNCQPCIDSVCSKRANLTYGRICTRCAQADSVAAMQLARHYSIHLLYCVTILTENMMPPACPHAPPNVPANADAWTLPCREQLHGHGHRRSHDRAAAHCGGHEHGLPAAGLQPDFQQCWHAPLHLRRPVQGGVACLFLHLLSWQALCRQHHDPCGTHQVAAACTGLLTLQYACLASSST